MILLERLWLRASSKRKRSGTSIFGPAISIRKLCSLRPIALLSRLAHPMTSVAGLTGSRRRSIGRNVKRPLILLLMLAALPLRAATNDPVTSFQQALEQTEKTAGPVRGSCTEQTGIRCFQDFLSHLDERTAREETGKVYAPDAYLNDTLKTIHGAPAIRDYFIRTAKGLDSMTVTFDDVAVSGRNYYFRWTMDTRMKNLARGKTVRTIGVTLVRFDREGRVILHQDFWIRPGGLGARSRGRDRDPLDPCENLTMRSRQGRTVSTTEGASARGGT